MAFDNIKPLLPFTLQYQMATGKLRFM